VERHHLPYLMDWYHRKTRKPLIIRGARQVGKTTTVRMLAQSLDVGLIELNMEDDHTFEPLIEQNDPLKLFELIALERGMEVLDPEQVIIFFDEAQECPKLIAFLRYCYERAPQYRVIVTGSLLEFVLEDYQYSFPVGRVEFMYLGPLTFEEYLLAMGQRPLLNKLQNFKFDEGLIEPIQAILERHFRDYLVCGGMPAAVKVKADSGGMLEVERAKSEILEAYHADFPKYHKRSNTALLQTMFQQIPLRIGNKISPVKLATGTKARDIWAHLGFLELALLVRRSVHTGAGELPLASGIIEKRIKLLFLDVGLVQSTLGVSIPEIETSQDINSLAKGAIAEQYVGQHLMAERPFFEKPSLYHWDRPVQGSEAEVDFIVALDGKVIPVEVKGGTGGSMKALRLMLVEKKLSFALRFYSGPPRIDEYSVKTSGGQWPYHLMSLPHFMIKQWPRLVKEWVAHD